ncbi:MAG: signal peptidase I [Chloroflexota bacterium]
MGRFVGALLTIAALGAAVAWFVMLRPAALGGPAGYILVSGRSMEPNVHEGSLVVTLRQPDYRAGDIVAYRIPAGEPAAGLHVIHRIFGGSRDAGFVMRGDNASGSDVWRPGPDDILGKAQVIVPGAMTVLLFARSPIVAASTAAALAVYLILGFWTPRPRAARPEPGRSYNPVPSDMTFTGDAAALRGATTRDNNQHHLQEPDRRPMGRRQVGRDIR